MTGMSYLTYLVKVQGSPDPILIHSAGLSLVNHINVLVYGVNKAFVFQRHEESSTAFKVEPTKMIAHGNNQCIKSHTELLNAENPAEVEAI